MQYSIEFHSPLSDMLKYGKQRKHFFLFQTQNATRYIVDTT